MVKLDSEKFEIINIGSQGFNDVSVVVDKETGVQYLLVTTATKGTGLTVLVDEDGKPKLRKQFSNSLQLLGCFFTIST